METLARAVPAGLPGTMAGTIPLNLLFAVNLRFLPCRSAPGGRAAAGQPVWRSGTDRAFRLSVAALLALMAAMAGPTSDGPTRRERPGRQVEPGCPALPEESKTRAISFASRVRHVPGARSPSARPPTASRCSATTWLPAAANMRRTWW